MSQSIRATICASSVPKVPRSDMIYLLIPNTGRSWAWANTLVEIINRAKYKDGESWRCADIYKPADFFAARNNKWSVFVLIVPVES